MTVHEAIHTEYQCVILANFYPVRLVTDQDIPFALILWYVAKIIYVL